MKVRDAKLLSHVLTAVIPAVGTQVSNYLPFDTVSETGLALGLEWVEKCHTY